ncbi:hypothetical protein [Thiocapsa marina]|uniref:Uncharacterized protein n=1 Tax=Thiocapsa marina 5811 TaxID=768671 RepID=F9UCN0_9GAMM|nr:hypothetical protein [Thiocapsa marina]EGV18143.1 hypothetical protein ThimaDRAFT_2682 [Thiocapsa marina 5811]
MVNRFKQLAAGVVALATTGAAIAGPGFPRPFPPPGARYYSEPAYPARPDAWIAPAVTGAIVGAVLVAQPRTVVVERPVQVIESAPGKTYKRVEIYIPECQCYRTYDVPID